jgi:hypothetical protein
MERHAPYIGNISAKKLFHSNADSHVNVRIAMENLPKKISPIKGAAFPKTYWLITAGLWILKFICVQSLSANL